jgi:prepilin-type N-terminal cleavage/methylation domain-containing protein
MSLAPSERLFGRCRRGFTLLETLITTVLFSIVMAGVFLLYTTMQTTLSRGELMTDLQQNARVAMDRMVQEIRMAGYDPSGAIPVVTLQPRAAIRGASSGCLSFVAYSTTSGASAQITYSLSGTKLMRRQDPWCAPNTCFGTCGSCATSSPQPLAESVNLLTLTYYDDYNQILTPYSTTTQGCPPGAATQTFTQLDYGQMKQIRRVAISLQTRDSRPDVFSQFYTLTNDVRFRNR